MYTDPTGHSKISKFFRKVEKAIEKAIQWLEKVTGADWDFNISAGGSVPFGPGGGNSPASPTTPYEDMGSPYYDYGYSYDPFFDPIVYSSLPPPEPSQALVPIPQRPLLDITTEELGNIHVLSQTDPIQAVAQSGDFGILDAIPAPEKIKVYGQLPGMLGYSQRAEANKTSLKGKISGFLGKASSAYSRADMPQAGLALKVAGLALSDAGPFEMIGRFGGGNFGGMLGSTIFGGLGALAGPEVAVPAAFWGGIFGASYLSERAGRYGRKIDLFIASHIDR